MRVMRSVSNQPELRGEAEARPFLLPSDLVRADVRRPVVRCAARHPQHADVARDTHRGLARPAAQTDARFHQPKSRLNLNRNQSVGGLTCDGSRTRRLRSRGQGRAGRGRRPRRQGSDSCCRCPRHLPCQQPKDVRESAAQMRAPTESRASERKNAWACCGGRAYIGRRGR